MGKMLLHKSCSAPVDLLEDESGDLRCVRWFCQICQEEILDDYDLIVIDSLGLLKESA